MKETSETKAPETPKKKDSKKFLVFYVVTLFLAAAVLILLSYLGEARNQNQFLTATNQEHQGAIQSAKQKLEQLQTDHTTLTQENAALKDQLSEVTRDRNLAEQRIRTRDRQLADAQADAAAVQTALTRLWWLERCYERGDRDAAADTLAAMEAAGDAQLLPTENPLDPEAESPRTRYNTIKEKLD